jgi:hypothetical protein
MLHTDTQKQKHCTLIVGDSGHFRQMRQHNFDLVASRPFLNPSLAMTQGCLTGIDAVRHEGNQKADRRK